MRKLWRYLIIIVQVLIVSSLVKGIFETMSSQNRVDVLVERRDSLETMKSETEVELEKVRSDSYLEEVARNQLNLVKTGETIVIVSQEHDLEKAHEEVEQNELPNWRKWLNLLLSRD